MTTNRKIKVCHIISFISYSLFIEAIGQFLDKEEYEISFIFLNPDVSPIERALVEGGYRVEHIDYRGRKQFLSTVYRLRKLLKNIGPDIVHTHLVDASMAGLVAARTLGIKRRLHTRHHGAECHIYYPHGVYYDKLINRLSSRIIATTGIVRDILVDREGANEKKVRVIPYGYDLSRFDGNEQVTNELADKYGLRGHYPVIGMISRFVELKGIQYVIPAFARISKEYPDAKLVLANASGDYAKVVNSLLERELSANQYVKIVFETKIFDLYSNFDIFLHVPVTRDAEAFGQTYIEALYAEIPSVLTIAGIAPDFIRDGENAVVVPYCDSDAIYAAMQSLLKDEELRKRITKDSKNAVCKLFGGESLAIELDNVYVDLMSSYSK